jgi:hypothetical protein
MTIKALSARGSASICIRGPEIMSSNLDGRSKIVCEIEYASHTYPSATSLTER